MDLYAVHPQAGGPVAPPSRRGFTLIELMLSLVLSALITGTIAGMLMTVSRGVMDSTDQQGRSNRAEVACGRIDRVVRPTGRILATGSGYLVLWMADTTGNQAPNLSELQRIEYDSTNHQIKVYAAPAGVTPDTGYLLTDDFATITAGLKGTASFPGTAIVLNCTGWTVATTSPLNTAKLVYYTLTLTDTQGGYSVHGAANIDGRIPTGG